MGAKFKAPLDSRCFAEMEEQHFRLPLPPYVCLSFALLSFLSFSASTSLSLPPCFVFHPPFIPSLYLASSPLLPPPTHCLLLFLLSIFNSAVRSVLRRPSFVPPPPFVSQSGFHHVCQSFKSDRHWSARSSRGCCPGASLLTEPNI